MEFKLYFIPICLFFSLSTADIKGCEFFFNIEIGRKKPFSKQNFFEFTHKANIKSFCLMKYKSLVFSNCILNKSFDSFKSRILDIKNKCVCKWQKGNQFIPGQDAVS